MLRLPGISVVGLCCSGRDAGPLDRQSRAGSSGARRIVAKSYLLKADLPLDETFEPVEIDANGAPYPYARVWRGLARRYELTEMTVLFGLE
jgi:hypothetical protein